MITRKLYNKIWLKITHVMFHIMKSVLQSCCYIPADILEHWRHDMKHDMNIIPIRNLKPRSFQDQILSDSSIITHPIILRFTVEILASLNNPQATLTSLHGVCPWDVHSMDRTAVKQDTITVQFESTRYNFLKCIYAVCFLDIVAYRAVARQRSLNKEQNNGSC
jgi:hypothetical protein